MRPHDRNALPKLVTSFFQEHLQRICGASPHTVRAYAHALRLYLAFVSDSYGRAVSTLRLEDLAVEGVEAFLAHLEQDRKSSPVTRNCRLAALRSFFRYLARHDPVNADTYHRVLALPSKRARTRPATYLEPEQVRAILSTPDRRTVFGIRDHALLLLLYNTGARVAEALAIRQEDVELARRATVRLRGKGNRERICPLWPETVAALRHLGEAQPPAPQSPVFRSARGRPLTRDGVAYILDKHVRHAASANRTIRRVRVTPHVLRHSCAVALLQAGVDLTVIRDYLGHASVATTNRYVATNLDMRQRVLEAFWKRAGIESKRPLVWKPRPDLLQFLASL